ncbi:MAG: DsrE/DsrF/DrsH-like family protein [Chloroflexi bacterium]|nr:DsrE/DsrF/DrsH-like family protein [Chloroflexota bacterium]
MTNDFSETELVTISLHSGSYDRVTNALSLSIICLAMGMDVTILLTYEALRRFVKGHLEDMEGTDDEFQNLFHDGIERGSITSIEGKLTEAKNLGLKLYACPSAMATMNIVRQDLVDEVDDLMGLATFIGLARTAKINWYI